MDHLSTVFDIQKSVGRGYKVRHTGGFGVEIETETVRKYDFPMMKYWEAKKDGSLRDWGVEYVLKAPMAMPEVERALEEFQEADKKYNFRKGSISTSVHVHLNMLNESYLTVANFLTAWIIIEGLLVKYSGPDRLSNVFCFPTSDAEGIVDHWAKFLEAINRNMFKNATISPELVKYSSLNIATMSSLGTVEARTFRGETDIKVIQKWLDILDKLKAFSAKKDMTPPKILSLWEKYRSGIVDIIFLEDAKELKCKDFDKLITADNIKLASKLACVSKNWEKFGVLKIKPVYKEMLKEQLEEIAMAKHKHPFDELGYHERIMVYEYYQRMNPTTRIVDLQEDV